MSAGEIDYQEPVELRCSGQAMGRLPLHQAVRQVIEEWEDDQQQAASIVRADGTGLPHLHAIRTLYERGDFPHMTA